MTTRLITKSWRKLDLDRNRRAARWLRAWRPRWLIDDRWKRHRPRKHGRIAIRLRWRTQATRDRLFRELVEATTLKFAPQMVANVTSNNVLLQHIKKGQP